MVLHKGDREGGTILLSLVERGGRGRIYERMPQLSGGRAWTLVREEEADPQGYSEYLARRAAQDRDLWVVELDVANAERFIGFPPR